MGVPKAVTLYKSKVIEALVREMQAQLSSETLSEEDETTLLQRLAALNKAKVAIARKLQRLIL